jgi:hypothetical protein
LQETEEQDSVLPSRDALFDQRSQVIANFYVNATVPRDGGFNQVA